MKKLNTKGFGLLGVLAVIVVLAAAGGVGAYVYHKNHKAKTTTSSTGNSTSTGTKTGSTSGTTQTSDPYAGWKTYCDGTASSCIKYPSTWIAVNGFPGAFENSTNTAYISLEAGTSKDRAQATAYIYSVEGLSTSGPSLDIVGYVVGNKPAFGVYNSAYVSTNDIKAGATAQLVDGNYAFNAKDRSTISLIATPGAAGYAAITTSDQARAWFTTQEAQDALLVMRSFYYQQ